MKRSADKWNRCNPIVMAGQSKVAIVFAFEDAKADILELYRDAMRYKYLRNRDLETIKDGGIFAGSTPDNMVLNGDDLDSVIDAAMSK